MREELLKLDNVAMGNVIAWSSCWWLVHALVHRSSISRSGIGGRRWRVVQNQRVFSGDDEDSREYKRWKVWITNKLLTLSDKVPSTAKGAYVYTMLAGKALEAVEHLEPSSYQKADGEKVIFDLLDRGFPQKEATDELSENLTAIFGLKATDGEGLKQWISRASEAFDKLQRKTGVNFPEEARGWLILNRSGLSTGTTSSGAGQKPRCVET